MRRVFTLVYLALSMYAVESIQADTITEFRATLSAENVIRGGGIGSMSTATGTAVFTLMQPDDDPMGATIRYEVHTNGVDLNGEQTLGNGDDNMQGIHVHDTNVCVPMSGCEPGDTAGTVHVLNIAGFPRNGDDEDVVIDAPNNLVTGRWDEEDVNLTPPPTVPVWTAVDQLFAGDIFVMVHTNEFNNGAMGGYLTIVPEPASGWLILLGITSVSLIRRGDGGIRRLIR